MHRLDATPTGPRWNAMQVLKRTTAVAATSCVSAKSIPVPRCLAASQVGVEGGGVAFVTIRKRVACVHLPSSTPYLKLTSHHQHRASGCRAHPEPRPRSNHPALPLRCQARHRHLIPRRCIRYVNQRLGFFSPCPTRSVLADHLRRRVQSQEINQHHPTVSSSSHHPEPFYLSPSNATQASNASKPLILARRKRHTSLANVRRCDARSRRKRKKLAKNELLLHIRA